jgi:hypothetical protein
MEETDEEVKHFAIRQLHSFQTDEIESPERNDFLSANSSQLESSSLSPDKLRANRGSFLSNDENQRDRLASFDN